MAAKRSAEKAANIARGDAEKQRRESNMAKLSAEAEHERTVRAEEAQRLAVKQLEAERERVRLLTEKKARHQIVKFTHTHAHTTG